MKKLFILLLLLLLPLPAFASLFPHIKIAVYDLGGVYYIPDQTVRSKVVSWYSNHADFVIASGLAFPNTTSVYYTTIIGIYSTTADPTYTVYKDLRNFAESNGYEFENILIHMKQDFTARMIWSGMDKFDAFEGANGVIVDNAGVLSDKTKEGYDTVAGDVSFRTNLYIGYLEPFAEMNINMSVFSSGLSGQWQYWDGSVWKTFSVSDGTNNFIQNGKITFVPPSDWKRTVLNNSLNKYFVRYHVNSFTVQPLLTRIYGDNWMTGTKARGWLSDDPNIINNGIKGLEYNPNPPASATAKFRYQARATGYWANNYVFVNPAYVVSGKRVWGEFNAQKSIDYIKTHADVDGVYFDSLGGTMTNGISDPPTNQEKYSDFVDYTSNSWSTESLETYKYMVSAIHSVLPSALVGGNTPYANYAMSGDYGFRESASSPGFGGAFVIMQLSPDGYTSYDNFLPANNPKGLIGIFQHIDTVDYRPVGAYWDRSNRGPITSLSSHYIAMNDKTYFHYFSRGGFFYIEADDILVYDPRETVLTADLAIDTSSNTKYIRGQDFSNFPSTGDVLRPVKVGSYVLGTFKKVDNQTLSITSAIYYPISAGVRIKFVAAANDRLSNYTTGNYPNVDNVYRWGKFFPAMFVDIGQPDAAGWNGGNRGTWNTIYRRDFTNAIVVNKMAMYNTTVAEFDTYSAPMALGGTYYPLKADGRLGAPISQISLRTGEGAILMKQGIPSGDTIPPANPTGVTVL